MTTEATRPRQARRWKRQVEVRGSEGKVYAIAEGRQLNCLHFICKRSVRGGEQRGRSTPQGRGYGGCQPSPRADETEWQSRWEVLVRVGPLTVAPERARPWAGGRFHDPAHLPRHSGIPNCTTGAGSPNGSRTTSRRKPPRWTISSGSCPRKSSKRVARIQRSPESSPGRASTPSAPPEHRAFSSRRKRRHPGRRQRWSLSRTPRIRERTDRSAFFWRRASTN